MSWNPALVSSSEGLYDPQNYAFSNVLHCLLRIRDINCRNYYDIMGVHWKYPDFQYTKVEPEEAHLHDMYNLPSGIIINT